MLMLLLLARWVVLRRLLLPRARAPRCPLALTLTLAMALTLALAERAAPGTPSLLLAHLFQGLGFRGWGLGLENWGFVFGAWGLGFRV